MKNPLANVLYSDFKCKYELSSLHTILCGEAPLSKKVTEGFTEKYPTVKIIQGYGLTESTGI